MQKIWFVYDSDKVRGPFLAEEVAELLRYGKISENVMVWSKGQKEWMPVSFWKSNLAHILEQKIDTHLQSVWKYELNGETFGPMTQVDLIRELKNCSSINHVRVSTGDYQVWDSIFTVGEIVEELGHSRRTHPRAPLIGKAEIFPSAPGESDPILTTETASISVGGIGLKRTNGLQIGDVVKLHVSSPVLSGVLRTRAKVLYISDNGFAGFQFLQLNTEASSIIMDYVRMFNTEGTIGITDHRAA